MKLVVLSGSGISAESGIQTFRGKGGLWEGQPVHEVATPEAWIENPQKVLKFYNERRAGIIQAKPNPGHYALVELEKHFDVYIITQNVDDLHERAGSSKILHLHGEIRKSRSTLYSDAIYDISGESLNWGDACPKGHQLRPHIVWFGESVEAMPEAESICQKADLLIVTGTSLQVYPANLLVYEAPKSCPIFVVDPEAPKLQKSKHIVEYIRLPASIGLPELTQHLIQKFS
jgi:NAD-dependent deacetylase